MSALRTVGLVAWREIQVRVREKSFLVSGAVSLFLIAAITLLPTLLSPDSGPESVAATDARGLQIAQAAARRPAGEEAGIQVRRLAPDRARAALAQE